MTNEVAIHNLFVLKLRSKLTSDKEALNLAIKALEQQPCEDCISRKRVIMLIDEATEKYPYKIIELPDTYSNYNQGWTDACDWLYANIESDNLPSVTPSYNSVKTELKPCEDCISREAVIDGLDKYIEKAQSTGTKDDFISFQELVVKQLPSVTPKAETEAYNKGYTDAMRDIGDTQ